MQEKNFYVYCLSKVESLKETIEKKLDMHVLDMEIMDMDDDFLFYVSTMRGNNRLLLEREGKIIFSSGTNIKEIKDIIIQEKGRFELFL